MNIFPDWLGSYGSGEGTVIVEGIDVVLGGSMTATLDDGSFVATLGGGLVAILEEE